MHTPSRAPIYPAADRFLAPVRLATSSTRHISPATRYSLRAIPGRALLPLPCPTISTIAALAKLNLIDDAHDGNLTRHRRLLLPASEA